LTDGLSASGPLAARLGFLPRRPMGRVPELEVPNIELGFVGELGFGGTVGVVALRKADGAPNRRWDRGRLTAKFRGSDKVPSLMTGYFGRGSWSGHQLRPIARRALRSRTSLPVRLEPRDRPAERRDGDREGRPRPALPQSHAVRASRPRETQEMGLTRMTGHSPYSRAPAGAASTTT
jgi:hypothetical protein